MDIEQAEELKAYLRSKGHIKTSEAIHSRVLAGGVSNRTVLVERVSGKNWVMKQALAKLRVKVDWFSNPERIHREAEGMRYLFRFAPEGSITKLVFEDHEIVFSEGTATESFFPGPEAMRSVPEPARAELAELFPELELAGTADRIAHLVPPAAKQRRLLARHQKNAVPLFVPEAAFIHRAPSTRASATAR